MSVRAYRVISKELAENCSFNLWNDNDLIDFFKENDENNCPYFNLSEGEDGGGTCEINVALLEKALREYKWDIDDYRIPAIKADIEWAKKNKTEWVNYECF